MIEALPEHDQLSCDCCSRRHVVEAELAKEKKRADDAEATGLSLMNMAIRESNKIQAAEKLNADLSEQVARKNEALRDAGEFICVETCGKEQADHERGRTTMELGVQENDLHLKNHGYINAALSPSSSWLAERDRKQDSEALERIAAFCHSQWSGWMEYLFSKTNPKGGSGEVLIPGWAVKRWTHQMKTPYADLGEKEKESDRTEARGFFAALRASVQKGGSTETLPRVPPSVPEPGNDLIREGEPGPRLPKKPRTTEAGE